MNLTNICHMTQYTHVPIQLHVLFLPHSFAVDVGDVRSDTGGDLGGLGYLSPTTSLINFPSVRNVTNFASLNNLSIIFTSEFDLTEIHHQNNLQEEDKPERTNVDLLFPTSLCL